MRSGVWLLVAQSRESNSLLLIVSGPAGSGKTTLCERLIGEFGLQIGQVITSTTRPPREGEKNGLDYHFFSEEEFMRRVDADEFYERAQVYNFQYGTLKSEIQEKLLVGIDLLLNIDVQGAASYREAAQSDPLLAERLVTLFVKPENLEQLRERLQKRGLDDEQTIRERLSTAKEELEHCPCFDHQFTSHDREEDYRNLRRIYLLEKKRHEEGLSR